NPRPESPACAALPERARRPAGQRRRDRRPLRSERSRAGDLLRGRRCRDVDRRRVRPDQASGRHLRPPARRLALAPHGAYPWAMQKERVALPKKARAPEPKPEAKAAEPPPSPVLALQRAAGNRAVGTLLARDPDQPDQLDAGEKTGGGFTATFPDPIGAI